ncbi:MAG: AMP-binding protein, partial [Cyanobacteriota bacterium]|nr:AMP-binding protein [Cyanobacteriota bacterium]
VLFFADTAELEKNRVVASKPDREGARAYVSCGQLVCDTQVAIVNPDTFKRCAPNEVGEIWVSDPSVAGGYWQRPEATKETFQARIAETDEGPFLRTGDLGFMKDGELFITGRIKDLIIIRGTNHYPQDIEWTVQQVHAELRPDYGAAFSIEVRGEEHLVVVQEVERRAQELEPDRAIADIRQAVAEEFELQTYAVVLAKPGNILKTASGKIQRRACKANFLSGTLTAIADWSEDPKLTSKYRDLQGQVESLAAQVKKP